MSRRDVVRRWLKVHCVHANTRRAQAAYRVPRFGTALKRQPRLANDIILLENFEFIDHRPNPSSLKLDYHVTFSASVSECQFAGHRFRRAFKRFPTVNIRDGKHSSFGRKKDLTRVGGVERAHRIDQFSVDPIIDRGFQFIARRAKVWVGAMACCCDQKSQRDQFVDSRNASLAGPNNLSAFAST